MTKKSDLSEIVHSSFHLGFIYLPRCDSSQYVHLDICEGKTRRGSVNRLQWSRQSAGKVSSFFHDMINK